jgi:hypothetical protein
VSTIRIVTQVFIDDVLVGDEVETTVVGRAAARDDTPQDVPCGDTCCVGSQDEEYNNIVECCGNCPPEYSDLAW